MALPAAKPQAQAVRAYRITRAKSGKDCMTFSYAWRQPKLLYQLVN
jgi:hypothetical protein